VTSIGVALGGCATTPRQPPGKPPSPASITEDEPGGDAHDPEAAALQRQLDIPWGWRTDKDNQLRVPLVDYQHFKRVRYLVFDHFVGFRYGKDYLVMNAAFVHDVPDGEKNDTTSCMRRAEKWAWPQLKSFQVQLERPSTVEQAWHGESVLVKTVEGYVDFGLKRRRFSGAYAAYPAYPKACLVFGVAVPWGDHGDLARKVRDRWVAEAVPKLQPLTKTRPYRK
jgi:hypothetical protein